MQYVITKDTLNLYLYNKTYTLQLNELNKETRKKLTTALEVDDKNEVYNIVDMLGLLEHYLSLDPTGSVKIKGSTLYYAQQPLHGYLSNKIMHHAKNNYPVKPLVKFLQLLFQNPSFDFDLHSYYVDYIFKFLEKEQLPITDDGHVLAYKFLNGDFTDMYSGKYDNSPGSYVYMDRSEVDHDPSKACSSGLHVGTYNYCARPSHKKVVVCKISPKDICCVPQDHDFEKMRCCAYYVLGELGNNQQLPEQYLSAKQLFFSEENYVKVEKEASAEDMRAFYAMFFEDYSDDEDDENDECDDEENDECDDEDERKIHIHFY